jgi:16S rRNA (guanine527-N7)-methyltransferase
VGSGGGLPIVPFRLLRPDCRLTLVEPRAKRVAFLRTAARELGFEASEILHGSDQEVEESAFSVATSRATFEPPSWLRIGQRLVDRNGLVAVFASSEFVPASGSWGVSESLVYQTESGARRWLGVFRST